jgi:hypothetical protein
MTHIYPNAKEPHSYNYFRNGTSESHFDIFVNQFLPVPWSFPLSSICSFKEAHLSTYSRRASSQHQSERGVGGILCYTPHSTLLSRSEICIPRDPIAIPHSHIPHKCLSNVIMIFDSLSTRSQLS